MSLPAIIRPALALALLTCALEAGAGDSVSGVGGDLYGGRPALGRWPGMAALLLAREPNNAKAQLCGATLISPQHVLTSARCAYRLQAADFHVLVGTTDLASGGKRVPVLSITLHPLWDERKWHYDVAVLKLTQPVRQKVTPFIASLAEEDQLAPTGSPVVVAGWGQTDFGSPDPTQLQKLREFVVDRTECDAAWDGWDNILEDQMCAGTGRADKMVGGYGDLGGPLWARDAATGERVQIGVLINFLTYEIGDYFPDVYSRLATLGAWVREQMN